MKTIMFYLPENRHICNRELLIENIRDIARKGFEGILMQVRDTAFQLDDPEVIHAVEIVTNEAHCLGLKVVMTFVTTNCRPWASSYFKQHPAEGDFYVRRAEGHIRNGLLTASTVCNVLDGESRIGHIDRVVAAFRRTDNGFTSLKPFAAEFSAERKIRYEDMENWHPEPGIALQVTGTVNDQPDGQVVLYVGFKVLEPDYESPSVRQYLSQLLDKYRHIPLDGTAWDEPGFQGANQAGGWNCYKVSPPFLERFERENGYNLCDRLPWLDEDYGAESLRIRYDYFHSLNNALYDAQTEFVSRSRLLFGEKMFSGIHHTFMGEEYIDDAYVGCSDYFSLAGNLSGGFTDGSFSCEKSMYYTLRLAASLGKIHPEEKSYSNSWDFEPTTGKVAYFSRLMAIWKIGWIGHAYGKSMGCFGPGYPLNDSWQAMNKATGRLRRSGEFLGNARERIRVAVYHSWETPVFLNSNFAQLSKKCLLNLSMALVNLGIPFDFIGADQVAHARTNNGILNVGDRYYDYFVVPWGCMLPSAVWGRIQQNAIQGGKLIFCGPPVFCTTDGHSVAEDFFRLVGCHPFSLADYQEAYSHYRSFRVGSAANSFHFPLQAAAGEELFAHDYSCSGVRRHGTEIYYLSYADSCEQLSELIRKLNPDRKLNTDAFNAIAAIYDEDQARVLAVTGRYDRPWSGTIHLDDHKVYVQSGKLLLLRIGTGNIEAIGEEVEGLTVDGEHIDVSEM